MSLPSARQLVEPLQGPVELHGIIEMSPAPRKSTNVRSWRPVADRGTLPHFDGHRT
jgi:hypothetical protein